MKEILYKILELIDLNHNDPGDQMGYERGRLVREIEELLQEIDKE